MIVPPGGQNKKAEFQISTGQAGLGSSRYKHTGMRVSHAKVNTGKLPVSWGAGCDHTQLALRRVGCILRQEISSLAGVWPSEAPSSCNGQAASIAGF